jgi:hypothetical protein
MFGLRKSCSEGKSTLLSTNDIRDRFRAGRQQSYLPRIFCKLKDSVFVKSSNAPEQVTLVLRFYPRL